MFLDLEGASGRTYRFKVWQPEEPHHPMAGNYAFVADGDGDVRVLGIGATTNLSRAREPLTQVKRLAGSAVYTRLNVPRGTREAEHLDLVARYKPGFVGDDPT